MFVIQCGKSQTTKASFTYQKTLCYEPVAENIQRGKSQTTKASFTYQKTLCYEPVAENIQHPQLFWTYF